MKVTQKASVMVQIVLLVILLILSGCATVPYNYGKGLEKSDTLALRPGENQFDRGRPVAFVDGLGHYVLSLPSKLILWNWQVDNHDISGETEAALQKYLADNGLANVKVRVNQYAPKDEWRRLIKNKGMPGFFRYTAGVVLTTLYMILPDRVFAGLFGGDHYNPFTNTNNLYSDNPAIAIHEGGHAKDFARFGRWGKGWYAFLYMAPFSTLYVEGVATGDTIGYLRQEQKQQKEKDAYKILYPAYATYIGGEGLRWFPVDIGLSYLAQIAVAVPGHIVGRIKAANVDEPPEKTGEGLAVPVLAK